MDVEVLEDLSGQVALVTGANRGMGHLIARGLHGMGASVFAGTRRLEALEQEARWEPVQLDVTDEATVEQAVARVEEQQGHLDVLVNNAGIAPGIEHTLATEPTDEIDQVLATNLRGAMLVTKHALGLMLDQEGPRVVNMSSGMGSMTDMGGSAPAYRISKAGLNAMTLYLHEEFNASDGLIANAVCPGWVATDMGGPSAPRDPEHGARTPTWLCRFAPGAPSGRFWRDQGPIPW